MVMNYWSNIGIYYMMMMAVLIPLTLAIHFIDVLLNKVCGRLKHLDYVTLVTHLIFTI